MAREWRPARRKQQRSSRFASLKLIIHTELNDFDQFYILHWGCIYLYIILQLIAKCYLVYRYFERAPVSIPTLPMRISSTLVPLKKFFVRFRSSWYRSDADKISFQYLWIFTCVIVEREGIGLDVETFYNSIIVWYDSFGRLILHWFWILDVII